MSLLLSLASRAAPVVDLEAEMDHRLQDMASRYMFATNAEMNTGLDREMADLGVGIRKNAARRQERKDVAGGRRHSACARTPQVGLVVDWQATWWQRRHVRLRERQQRQ